MWTQLTVIDEKERRVVREASGGPWIFATLADDPRSIDEFIEAELSISDGMTAFKEGTKDPTWSQIMSKIREIRDQRRISGDLTISDVDMALHRIMSNYKTYRGKSKNGTARGIDSGGTVIVDMRDRVVTVKAYLERTLDEVPQSRRDDAVKQKRRIVHPRTQEAWYSQWGLLSELRSGKAGFRKVVKEGYISSHLLGTHGRHDISKPKNPTKENPEIYWAERENPRGQIVDGETFAQKIRHWYMQYSIPGSWTIRDGILHINHN